ncbi:MAG: hypothetical protein AAF654_06985 [Myxococcota bacterium]
MNRIEELLERELNDELSESERRELDRSGADVAERRRNWRSVRSAIEHEPEFPSMLEARLAQGVRVRQAVRDVPPMTDSGLGWAWISGALLAALAFLVFVLPADREEVDGPVSSAVSALATHTGPVEIQISDTAELNDEDEELVVVTF